MYIINITSTTINFTTNINITINVTLCTMHEDKSDQNHLD